MIDITGIIEDDIYNDDDDNDIDNDVNHAIAAAVNCLANIFRVSGINDFVFGIIEHVINNFVGLWEIPHDFVKY